MKRTYRVSPLALFGPALAALLVAGPPAIRPAWAQTVPRPPARQPGLPSETPAQLVPDTSSFEYVKHDVMIPVRDGVKLHPVVVVPQGAKRAPILLTRTPYSATALTSHTVSSHLGSILSGSEAGNMLSSYDNATDVIVEGGYIRVAWPQPPYEAAYDERARERQ